MPRAREFRNAYSSQCVVFTFFCIRNYSFNDCNSRMILVWNACGFVTITLLKRVDFSITRTKCTVYPGLSTYSKSNDNVSQVYTRSRLFQTYDRAITVPFSLWVMVNYTRVRNKTNEFFPLYVLNFSSFFFPFDRWDQVFLLMIPLVCFAIPVEQ
jgi:hypothetical protein